MWLLAFAILSLIIGSDLRQRGRELSYVSVDGRAADQLGRSATAAGGWISFAGGICLNIAVWLFF